MEVVGDEVEVLAASGWVVEVGALSFGPDRVRLEAVVEEVSAAAEGPPWGCAGSGGAWAGGSPTRRSDGCEGSNDTRSMEFHTEFTEAAACTT